MFESGFGEFATLLILASAVGVLGIFLRQPLLVSFIAAGVLIGPAGLGIIEITGSVELLAELGIAVLLFLVGLKLDPHLIRSIGAVALTTGLGQVVFTSVAGFGLCLLFGIPVLESTYIAVALTFSSTIIIVKLLSDKREIDSLHGRIALGFLIVQDLVVVIAMVVLSAFGVGSAADAAWPRIFGMVFYGVLFLAGVALFTRFLAEPLIRRIAQSPELLVCFAIGWAAMLAALGDAIGFSKELGGLIAGVSIAYTPYRETIASRMMSLRDFLLLFFFIGLGAQLNLELIGAQIGVALVLSLFVLIGNPLIVMAIMGWMGYRKRTGFLAGLTVAQISEFSLIFMAMGQTLNHVSEEAVGLVTLVGLITIGLSTYMILYAHRLYGLCERYLDLFERRVPRHGQSDAQLPAIQHYDVILFGLGRYGGAIYERLSEAGQKILAIDFDPDNVQAWRNRNIPAIYGDMADPDFLAYLPLYNTRWVIAATPIVSYALTHNDPRLMLIESLKHHGYTGRIAVAAQHARDAERLQQKGADLILMPFVDAADQAADLVLERQRRAAVPSAPETDENNKDIIIK